MPRSSSSFHQRSFVVARRWLGEMLLRLQLLERELLSCFQRRQFVLQLFVFFVLAFLRLFVDSQEAVELQHRSSHAEPETSRVLSLRIDVHGRLVETPPA